MSNLLRLLSFTATSFAKIDQSSPVIIVWPDDGSQKISVFRGDQAVGKTSALSAFAASCGLPIAENAINHTDKDRKIEFNFEKNDKRYRVRLTKTRFEIENMYEEGKWSKLSSPKTVMQEVIGPVGKSPLFLKEYSGEEQIAWIRSFFQFSEEIILGEKEIDKKIAKFYSDRRNYKSELKTIKSLMSKSEYDNNKRLIDEKISDIENKVLPNFDQAEVMKGKLQLDAARTKVDGLKEKQIESKRNVDAINSTITELEQRLVAAKKELEVAEQKSTEIQNSITVGEQFIADNSKYEKLFEEIEEQKKNNEDLVILKQTKESYEALVERSVTVSNSLIECVGSLAEARKEKVNYVTSVLPKIDGLEVCFPDNNDEEETDDAEKEKDTREGLYYNGISIVEMSESQLWSFYLVLLKSMNINIVMIENINSLGSGAIDTLNYFAETGGYVIASEMKREEKNMKIILTDKIA